VNGLLPLHIQRGLVYAVPVIRSFCLAQGSVMSQKLLT